MNYSIRILKTERKSFYTFQTTSNMVKWVVKAKTTAANNVFIKLWLAEKPSTLNAFLLFVGN
jgi:hypothetical protein